MGATGANAAGTELVPVDQSVAANSSVVLTAEGEIGVA